MSISQSGFNSTTVQLILYFSVLYDCTTVFQFHNGTINTMIRKALPLPNLCFNSTTVQLIQFPSDIAKFRKLFQFHNGTINTRKLSKITNQRRVVSIPQRYN